MTTNPNESATDAVNRTGQEILAALLAKDSAKANSYYAPDAVIATPGRPAAKDGRAVSKAIRDDTKAPNFKMSLSNEKTEVAGSVTWPTAAARSTSLLRTRRPDRRRMPRAPI